MDFRSRYPQQYGKDVHITNGNICIISAVYVYYNVENIQTQGHKDKQQQQPQQHHSSWVIREALLPLTGCPFRHILRDISHPDCMLYKT